MHTGRLSITRRTLLSIHPFGNISCKIAVTGQVLREALLSGVSMLPTGNDGGHFGAYAPGHVRKFVLPLFQY